MTGNKSNVEKLAGVLLVLIAIAITAIMCIYIGNVLMYIILAFIVSLIGKPLMNLLGKIRIKGKGAPSWLLAILTIIIIFTGLGLVITQIIPVVTGIIRDASLFSNLQLPEGNMVDIINGWVVSMIPSLGSDFDAVSYALDYLKGITSNISLTGIIGSVASVVSGVLVGLFSVAFIAFFFIKDVNLFRKIATAIAPQRFEAKVDAAVSDIERLLSRYFVGLIIEMIGVGLLDFLGLWGIARIGIGYALGIGFIAGLLNIIPYIGPLIGEILGVVLCVVLKYGTGVGPDVNIWLFALIVLAIMLSVQLVDNFVYQPLIYSTSIQATALETFIVILIGGTLGGIVGMLAAIPAYTVIRVVAGRFFADKKLIKRLMPDLIEHNE
ncbi:MAG: AI-2E family transporter [Bacteroidales bacterium]|nr:AI-2E family transporter [Bacteroidales bacterium]